MNHVPDEILAAIALGDDEVSTAARDHVDGCPVCSHEVAELTQVQALVQEELVARDAVAPVHLAPGARVWERIAAETGADPAIDGVIGPGTVDAPSGMPVVAADPAGPAGPADPAVPAVLDRPRSGRVEVTPRRRRWWVAAAAAACVAAGALIGHALWTGNADPAGQVKVVSAVSLTTLDPSHQKEGTAELLEASGVRQLKVDATTMPPGAGYVEVWLINADGQRMVSLGTMASTQGVFTVPPGAIEQGYTVVDLSREQFDDKPEHSGDSLMRGTLPV